jgi:glutamate/tyrosine decarboxylase-like PLP-dependent enzyme
MALPEHGIAHDDLMAQLSENLSADANWRAGRIFSLVYFAGDDVARVIRDAYGAAIYTNGLGPSAFRSLKKMESEVIGMTAGLVGLPEAVGNMTSGGTESILMALKTARDWARAEKGIAEPEVILPVTAHPAFDKACQYLGMKRVPIPIGADYRADVEAARAAVNPNTALIVGSAPCYPFGVIDDIPALGGIAAENGIPCHVDACLGGFLLPFIERLGNDVRPWDFRVPGVESISADLHKYGFAARGASTIMYRSKQYRRHQYFLKEDWPGGLYGSPTMAGSRPGGAVAASWAVLNYLGEDGYKRLAQTMLDTTKTLVGGINSIEGLRVIGEPDMTVFAFTSDAYDAHAVGDVLAAAGWFPDRQQDPPSLHIMVTPAHAEVADEFLGALEDAAGKVAAGEQTSGGQAAIYGAMAKMEDKTPVRAFISEFIDGMTKQEPSG